MAVHLTMGSLLQGHLQVHDELRVLNNDFFKTIAEWTSLLDNTGALDSSDYKELEESIENKLNVDDSNQELEFYPLFIQTTGINGGERLSRVYRIGFDHEIGKCLIPNELKGGY